MVNRVHVAVQPADAVMQVMPSVVLGVEQHQGSQLLPDERPQPWSGDRQLSVWHPDTLGDTDRQDVEHVVPQRQHDSTANIVPRHHAAWLYLVAPNPLPLGTKQVHQCERQHAAEIEHDGKDNRKQRRRDGPLATDAKVPQWLQQPELTRLRFEQTRSEVDVRSSAADVHRRRQRRVTVAAGERAPAMREILDQCLHCWRAVRHTPMFRPRTLP